VRVKPVKMFDALPEAQFAHILQRDSTEPGAYRLQLEEPQVQQLMKMLLALAKSNEAAAQ